MKPTWFEIKKSLQLLFFGLAFGGTFSFVFGSLMVFWKYELESQTNQEVGSKVLLNSSIDCVTTSCCDTKLEKLSCPTENLSLDSE